MNYHLVNKQTIWIFYPCKDWSTDVEYHGDASVWIKNSNSPPPALTCTGVTMYQVAVLQGQGKGLYCIIHMLWSLNCVKPFRRNVFHPAMSILFFSYCKCGMDYALCTVRFSFFEFGRVRPYFTRYWFLNQRALLEMVKTFRGLSNFRKLSFPHPIR